MPRLKWFAAIKAITPFIVRINTPSGSGTGMLIARSKTNNIGVIATAAHVIKHAHTWEQPIHILQPSTGKSKVLRPSDRAVLMPEKKDEAGLLINTDGLDFPDDPPELLKKGFHKMPGVDVGWLGFPALHTGLCFFAGHISAYINEEQAYLVDGVAIHGVSGGPAFFLTEEGKIEHIGVVTDYIPNRSVGEALPGLSKIVDVSEFHQMTESYKTVLEAKAEETPETQPEAEEATKPEIMPAPPTSPEVKTSAI